MFPHIHGPALPSGKRDVPEDPASNVEDAAKAYSNRLFKREMRLVSSSSSPVLDRGLGRFILESSEEPTVPTRWFHTAKSSDHFHHLLHQDMIDRRTSFEADELQSAFRDYAGRRELAVIKRDAERWEILFEFRDTILSRERWASVRLAGGDFAVYELMFRAEPHKYISCSRFITVLRDIYGFDVASTESTSDAYLLNLLHKIFEAFDLHGKDEMDWRSWLTCLRMLMKPLVMTREHLMWGFTLYGSSGTMDFEGGKVAYQDMRDLFSVLTSRAFRAGLLDKLDAAWVELCDLQTHLNMEARNARKTGKAIYGVRMYRTDFEKFCTLPTVAPLFAVGSCIGLRDSTPWTESIEDVYLNSNLMNHVKQVRRSKRLEHKVQQFVDTKHLRMKMATVKFWCEYVVRRMRCRYLMAAGILRFHVQNTAEAIHMWRQQTLAAVRIVSIQRAARGFIGRSEASFLRLMHALALHVQARYRGRIHYRRYQRRVQRKVLAAEEIQRFSRANFGRRRAKLALEEYVHQGIRNVGRERDRWMRARRDKAIHKIQTAWRDSQERWRIRQKKLAEAQQAMVQAQMEAMLKERERQRGVYERQLEKWYSDLRTAQLKARREEAFVALEREKIRNAQRRRKDDAIMKKLLEDQQREEEFENDRIQRWLTDWDQRVVDRAAAVEKEIMRIVNEPETAQEKKQRKAIFAERTKRLKKILQDAEVSKITLEVHEARDIALKQIIEREKEEEGLRVREEMKVAAVEYNEEKAKELEERKAKEARSRHQLEIESADKLVGAWRWYKAKCELRGRASRIYRKEFDVGIFDCYYVDQRSEKRLDSKPLSLGPVHLEVEDSWFMMRDGEQVPYYYNPKTMRMAWTKQPGTLDCEQCRDDFARRYDVRAKKFFCVSCWTEKHSSVTELRDRLRLVWKDINGGTTDAAEQQRFMDMFSDVTEGDMLIRQIPVDQPIPNMIGELAIDEDSRELLKASRVKRVKHLTQQRQLLQEDLTPMEKKYKEQYIERMTQQAKLVKSRLREEDAQASIAAVTKSKWTPGGGWPSCSMCKEAPAQRFCHDCSDMYCVDCFMEHHSATGGRLAGQRRGSGRAHTFHNVTEDLLCQVSKNFYWPEVRAPEAGLSSSQAYEAARELMEYQSKDSAQHLLENSLSKEIVGPQVPGKVAVETNLVSQTDPVGYGDLALDEWIRETLNIPVRESILYSVALEGLGIRGIAEVKSGKAEQVVQRKEQLMDVGFKRGHARRLVEAFHDTARAASVPSERDEGSEEGDGKGMSTDPSMHGASKVPKGRMRTTKTGTPGEIGILQGIQQERSSEESQGYVEQEETAMMQAEQHTSTASDLASKEMREQAATDKMRMQQPPTPHAQGISSRQLASLEVGEHAAAHIGPPSGPSDVEPAATAEERNEQAQEENSDSSNDQNSNSEDFDEERWERVLADLSF